MSEDQSDTASKWTVRAVPHEARSAATAAAKRDKMDLGPWLGRAIIQAIKDGRQSDKTPVPVRPEPAASPTAASPTAASPTVDLGELAEMMRLAEQYHTITGKAPRTITGPLSKLMRVRLKGMVGPT